MRHITISSDSQLINIYTQCRIVKNDLLSYIMFDNAMSVTCGVTRCELNHNILFTGQPTPTQ